MHTEKQLAATFRKEVLRVVTHRCVGLHKDKQSILALRADASLDLDWLVRASRGTASVVLIELTDFIADATKRTHDARRAEELVRADPAIMGGMPCFAKSRLPIANVIAALDAGETFAQLQADHPLLTPEHLTAARVYDTIRPRRGRPRQRGELNPHWKLKHTRVVRSRKA